MTLLPLQKPHGNNRWCNSSRAHAAPKSRPQQQDHAHDRYARRSEIDRPRRRPGRGRQTGRRRCRRRGCGARPLDRRVGAARQGREHRSVRERRCLAARLRRQAGGERLGDRGVGPEGAGRARRRHGEGVARGSLSGPRRSGPAGQAAARPRPVRRDRGLGRPAEGGGPCRRSSGPCRQGRHQFGRQQRRRRARRAGACHLARLRRPLCRVALFALGQRHCRRGHRHGARL